MHRVPSWLIFAAIATLIVLQVAAFAWQFL